MLAPNELERLNTALVFIDLVLMDSDEIDDLTVDDLIQAAQSYVRSVTMHGLRPGAEAEDLSDAMHATVVAYSKNCMAMVGARNRRG